MANDSFAPVPAARRVLRLATTGALGTLDSAEAPFVSLVTVATASSGAPILLLSKLAVHTQNLMRDPRASLLLIAPGGEGGDPLAGARLTLTGYVAGDADPTLRRRFLARQAEAVRYVDFTDFQFYRFDVEGAHLVAGFGRIVSLTPAELLTDCSEASGLIEAEVGAVDHMNDDHADALALYATKLLGMPAGDWVATGADPDGLDLRAGALRARLDFPERVNTSGELRAVLVHFAKEARAK